VTRFVTLLAWNLCRIVLVKFVEFGLPLSLTLIFKIYQKMIRNLVLHEGCGVFTEKVTHLDCVGARLQLLVQCCNFSKHPSVIILTELERKTSFLPFLLPFLRCL
jgi:hypothetical protein